MSSKEKSGGGLAVLAFVALVIGANYYKQNWVIDVEHEKVPLHLSLNSNWLFSLSAGRQFNLEGSSLQVGVEWTILTLSGKDGDYTWFPLEPEVNATLQRLGPLQKTWDWKQGVGYEIVAKLPSFLGFVISVKTSLSGPSITTGTLAKFSFDQDVGKMTITPLWKVPEPGVSLDWSKLAIQNPEIQRSIELYNARIQNGDLKR